MCYANKARRQDALSLSYRGKHGITCPMMHNIKTQNLQGVLICSTLTNILQHNNENDGITLAFLLQSATLWSRSNRDWAKIQLQLEKLLRFSILSGVIEDFSFFFLKHNPQPSFNLLHHFTISCRLNIILERRKKVWNKNISLLLTSRHKQ